MVTHSYVPPMGLTNEQAQQQFDGLQTRLQDLWPTISRLNSEQQTVVVVPSVSLEFALKGSEMQAYEERSLFLLFLLRQPDARLIYVTSHEIRPEIIDYYLALLPGVIPSHARKRLFMLSVGDLEPTPLTEKILRRPRFIKKIKGLIADPNRAHLVPYNASILERDLALHLGIPMYGCDPKHETLGSKSGGRRVFSKAGIPFPRGFENLSTLDQVVDSVLALKQQNPNCPAAMVKLNEGLSGEGNAMVDLTGMESPVTRAGIEQRVRDMTLELRSLSFEAFMKKLGRLQGIVEERIVAEEVTSPSVQLRITPARDVELLSTHDQLLGGASGQSYLGCIFPAADEYAAKISHEAMKVGKLLAQRGVLGRFCHRFSRRKKGVIVGCIRGGVESAQRGDHSSISHSAVPL